jgi:hypothetical protein
MSVFIQWNRIFYTGIILGGTIAVDRWALHARSFARLRMTH